MTFYCLSKKSRHNQYDVVTSLPCGFSPGMVEDDELYNVLRAAIFTSVKQAQMAADYCSTWNPVGYCVGVLEEELS